MMGGLLFQAFVYLCAAVIAVPIAKRLGLGSVLGYLLAGVVIGPVIGLVGSETQEIQHFAEFGVVMMLFLVGLELEPRMLWDMRNRLIGLGGLQVGVTAALIAAGMPLGSALVFLMAGPATNVATIGAVYRTLGGRVLGLYLGTVIVMSFILGVTFDFVLESNNVQTSHEHSNLTGLGEISAVIVIVLLAWLSMKRIGNRFFKSYEIDT